MKLPKLVRDKIPEIMKANEQIAVMSILNQEDYSKELLEKLAEEVLEVQNAITKEETLEELADVLELVNAIAINNSANLEEIEKIRIKKAQERGGFEQRILLEAIK